MKEKRQTLKSKKKPNSRKLTKKSNVRNDIYIGGDQGQTEFKINTENIFFKDGSKNIIIDVSKDISSVKNIIMNNLNFTGDLSINKITISNTKKNDIRSLDKIDNTEIQNIDVSDISLLNITISNEDVLFNNDLSTIITGYVSTDKSLNYLKTIVKKDLTKNVIGDVSINSIKFYKTNNSTNPSNEISAGNFDKSADFSLNQIYTDISDISSLTITLINNDISFINDTSSIVTHYTIENKKINKLKEEVKSSLKNIEFDTKNLHDKIFFYKTDNPTIPVNEISAGSFDNDTKFSLSQIYTDISDISSLTITISNNDITFNDDSSKVIILLEKDKTDTSIITNILNKKLNKKIIGKILDDQYTSSKTLNDIEIKFNEDYYKIIDISLVNSVEIELSSNIITNKILINNLSDQEEKLNLLKDLVLDSVVNHDIKNKIRKEEIDFYIDKDGNNKFNKNNLIDNVFKNSHKIFYTEIKNDAAKSKYDVEIEISGNLITTTNFTIKAHMITFKKIIEEVKKNNTELDLTDIYIECSGGLISTIYREDVKDDASFNAIKKYLISNQNSKKYLILKSDSENAKLDDSEINSLQYDINKALKEKDRDLINFSLLILKNIIK